MIGVLMRIDLIKYQALGNDYLVLDLPARLDEIVPMLPVLCDRHRGLGADGLLAFDPAAMTVRIFNPDRSEAQKSGNGLRIAAAHAVLEHSAGDRFDLHTVGRANPVRMLRREGAEVTSELDIGRASFRAADQPVTFARCIELGPHIETHPAFPERTNVQLFEVVDRSHVRIEIWERGAGYTLASGTSASAVAAACIRAGLVDDQVTVHMPGGDLEVQRMASGNLVQSGPARRVYRASVELDDFS